MSRAHQQTLLPAQDIIQTIDDNTIELFHYDISPNGVKGTKPVDDIYDDSLIMRIDANNLNTAGTYVVDQSRYGNHCTLGTATIENGTNGKALGFGGTNGNMLVAYNQILNAESITLEFLMKPFFVDATKTHMLISSLSGSGYSIKLVSTATTINIGGQTCSVSGLTEGVLSHFVVTAQVGGNLTVYNNGAIISDVPYTGTISIGIGNIVIVSAGGRTTGFKGTIDNISIYNRALTSTEVLNRYNKSICSLRHDGKYGNAIAIEEETTNLISSNRINFSSWSAYGGATVTLTQGQAIPGVTKDRGTRIQTTGGSGADTYLKYYESIGAGTAGTGASASVWVYNCGTSIVRVNGNEITGDIRIYPGEIKYCSISKASVTGIGHRQLRFCSYTNPTDSLDFIAFQPQMEEKPFSTSFINGSRANGKLYYNINIAPPATLSFWVNPQVPDAYSASVNGILGQCPYNDNLLIWKRTTEDYYRIRVNSPDISLSPGDITKGTWSHVTLVFSQTDTKAYVNGIYKGASGVLTPISAMSIGSTADQNIGNNIFDELRIDKIARTQEEILSWYLSGVPFHPKGNERIIY